jgi:peptide deformylase
MTITPSMRGEARKLREADETYVAPGRLSNRAADVILKRPMAVLPIVRYPDARLRQTSQPVEAFDDGLRKLVADMSDTMYAANGAGLAAIQVGVPLRLFIVDAEVAGGKPDDPVRVFANPELVMISDESQTGDEGCLSFPGVFVPLKRGLRARVRAQDLTGQTFELEGEGLLARAFQHESDHLVGRLLIDMVGPVKREIIKRKMKKEAAAAAQDPGASGAGSSAT